MRPFYKTKSDSLRSRWKYLQYWTLYLVDPLYVHVEENERMSPKTSGVILENIQNLNIGLL